MFVVVIPKDFLDKLLRNDDHDHILQDHRSLSRKSSGVTTTTISSNMVVVVIPEDFLDKPLWY